jgi:hypothetical protein
MADPRYRWRVDIFEYERGWGRRHEGAKFFDDENEAYQFVRDYNSENTETVVPDWYMAASAPQKVQVA